MSGDWRKSIICVEPLGVVPVRDSLVKLFWSSCAGLLLICAVVAYVEGRPAAELHAAAVKAERSTDAAEPSSAPSAGPQTGASATPSRSTGPGVDSPGVAISARVSTPTSLDVSELVRLAIPVTFFTIAPPDVTGAAKDLGTLTPALTEVQVTADGQVVPILQTRITGPLQVDLPTPANELEVRYVLDAAVVRTLPSKAGRALAGLAPVVAGADDSRVTYRFAGGEIIGVSCPDLGATAFACAGGEPGSLTVASPLERSESLVLLQLNLARP